MGMTGRMMRLARYAASIDRFLLVLIAVVLTASFLPVRGAAAGWVDIAADVAIMLLFFLHGAKLSRAAIMQGIGNWRLHLLVLGSTYVLFPAVGLGVVAVAGVWANPLLLSGLLYLTLLPSTVQSSIAFTAMAGGNVAAAVCSASLSNLLGIVLTPLLVGLLMQVGGGAAGSVWHSVETIAAQLLLPFVAGHLLRPLIAGFIDRNKKILQPVDRASILLVVYSAFSAAVVGGIWSRVSAADLIVLLALSAVILGLVMGVNMVAARLAGLAREDAIVLLFCGSKKSLVSGVPMAGALFPPANVGIIVLPLMIFHQLQLFLCAALAGRFRRQMLAAEAAMPALPVSETDIARIAAERGLPIPETCMPGVVTNMALLRRHAATLARRGAMRTATEIAAAVRGGRTSAVQVVDACLAGLEAEGGALFAVTRILADRARAEAAQVDAAIATGRDPGPLAGVPYGVKDLFDIAGFPTTAGSALYADAPPATRDAEAIRRLRDAGAVLVATLNMDEFAYGFATINARHGTTRNPHDPDRLAGGSSGGSAAAVAAGLTPFSLGSDTNGSIRVPASLTGLYGLKPTHADLPLEGVFPFAESFDDIGPFTRSVADMALVWGVLKGETASMEGQPLRIARLGGRFAENIDPDQIAAMEAIAPEAPVITLPDIARARSAAFLITACEGGRLHRGALATDAMRFDPQVRDRLIAGALLPDALYEEAQAFRTAFKAQILKLIEPYDVLLAPATPCPAPLIEDPRILIDGALSPARADLGIHSQPISFLGFPSLAVPLLRPGKLPLGLQLIGRPGGDVALFRFAAMLEQRGITGVTMPAGAYLGEIA